MGLAIPCLSMSPSFAMNLYCCFLAGQQSGENYSVLRQETCSLFSLIPLLWAPIFFATTDVDLLPLLYLHLTS